MAEKHLLHFIYPEKKPQSFFDSLKALFTQDSPYIEISLEMPKRELLRLQTFIDDVNELDQELDFSLENLISFLYSDLLLNARKGKLKNRPFSENLLLKYRELKVPKIQVIWKQVNPYRITRVEEPIPKSKSFIHYPILLRKKHVLRGEVLLMDLYEEEKEKIGIGVADLITHLLIEFADEIRKGATQKRIQSIMKGLH